MAKKETSEERGAQNCLRDTPVSFMLSRFSVGVSFEEGLRRVPEILEDVSGDPDGGDFARNCFGMFFGMFRKQCGMFFGMLGMFFDMFRKQCGMACGMFLRPNGKAGLPTGKGPSTAVVEPDLGEAGMGACADLLFGHPADGLPNCGAPTGTDEIVPQARGRATPSTPRSGLHGLLRCGSPRLPRDDEGAGGGMAHAVRPGIVKAALRHIMFLGVIRELKTSSACSHFRRGEKRPLPHDELDGGRTHPPEPSLELLSLEPGTETTRSRPAGGAGPAIPPGCHGTAGAAGEVLRGGQQPDQVRIHQEHGGAVRVGSPPVPDLHRHAQCLLGSLLMKLTGSAALKVMGLRVRPGRAARQPCAKALEQG